MKSQVTHNIKGDQSIARTVTEQNTKFNVVEGKISAIMTETEYQDLVDGDKTLYGKTVEVEQTVDSYHKSYVQDKVAYDATAGKVTGMESKVATIEDSVDGLSTEFSVVRSNYVSKGDLAKGFTENLNTYPYSSGGTRTQNGITFTAYEDGTIEANGTATGGRAYYYCQGLSDAFKLDVGTYTVSGCFDTNENTWLILRHYNQELSKWQNFSPIDYGDGAVITINDAVEKAGLYIGIKENTICDHMVFKPMLERGNIAHEYTPYKLITIDDEVMDAVRTIETRTSTLEQTADHLQSEIDALDIHEVDVEAAIAAIEIGGAQLLNATNKDMELGTSASKSDWTDLKWVIASGGTGNGLIFPLTTAETPAAGLKYGWRITCTNTGNKDFTQRGVPLKSGNYILSGYRRVSSTSTVSDPTSQIRIWQYSPTNKLLALACAEKITNTEWEEFSHKVSINPDAENDIGVLFGIKGEGSIEYCGCKLEKGNKGTKWSFSLMDVEADAAEKAQKALEDAKDDAGAKAAQAVLDALEGTDNKLTSYSTTNQMNSAISQTKQEIEQTVSANYTTKMEFGALEIGGRNLLWDTNAPTIENNYGGPGTRYWTNLNTLENNALGTEWGEISNSPVAGIRYGAKLVCTTTGGSRHGVGFYNYTGYDRLYNDTIVPYFSPGHGYTLSCWVKSDTAGARIHLLVQGPSSGEAPTYADDIYTIQESEVGSWIRVKRSFKWNAPEEYRVVYFESEYNKVGTVEMCAFQMEKGTVPTDWTEYTNSVIPGNGYNLIHNLDNLSEETGNIDATKYDILPDINGFYNDGSHYGNIEKAANVQLSGAEHGIRATAVKDTQVWIRFGTASTDAAEQAKADGLFGLKAGKTYTFSADVKTKLFSSIAGDDTKTIFYLYSKITWGNSGSTSWTNGTYTTAIRIDYWNRGKELSGRLVGTFTIPVEATRLYLAVLTNSSTNANFKTGDFIELSNMKLEEGNRATDWSSNTADTSKAIEKAKEDSESYVKDTLLAYSTSSDVEAKIQQKADSILSKVSGKDVTESTYIRSVYGGTQMLPDTNASSMEKVTGTVSRYLSTSDNATYAPNDKCVFVAISDPPVPGIEYGYQIEVVTAADDINKSRALAWRDTETTMSLRKGEAYTMSFYAKLVSGTEADLIQCYNAKSSVIKKWHRGITNTEWKQFSYTFTYPEDATKNPPVLYVFGVGMGTVCKVQACGFRLEHGTEASEWTPAPQEAGILAGKSVDDKLANYVTETDYNTGIEQTKDSIRSYVQKTYSTKETVTDLSKTTIKTDTIYYLASDQASGVTRDTSGWSTEPQFVTSTNRYLWTYHLYTKGDDSTVPTTPVISGVYGDPGKTGAAAINSAVVMLYQRAESAPAKPTATLRYTFATGKLTGTLGNWSQGIPSGTDPCWVTYASASGQAAYDDIPASEWVAPVEFVANGDPGATGPAGPTGPKGGNGENGYNQATIQLYQRADAIPSKPSVRPQYTFATGKLASVPTDWSITVPNSNGKPCWTTSAAAVSRDASVTVGAWTDVVKLVENGAKGDRGASIVSMQNLFYANNVDDFPTGPTSKVTNKKSEVGKWTTAIPALTKDYPYLYSCDQIKYDDTSIGVDGYMWTDVVKNESVTDLTVRLNEAEEKITDESITQTVSSKFQALGDVDVQNLLPYPYHNETYTTNGITFTVQSDGSIKANGTATANAYFNITYPISATASNEKDRRLTAGTYTLSGCPDGGGANYSLRIQRRNADGTTNVLIASDTGAGKTFDLEDNIVSYKCYIIIANGNTVNNLIFKPQLEYGSKAHLWRSPMVSAVSEIKQTSNEILLTVKEDYQSKEDTEILNCVPFPYHQGSGTESNGITYTVSTTGVITANGTATADSEFWIIGIKKGIGIAEGKYFLSGCPSGGSVTTYYLNLQYDKNTDGDGTYTQVARDIGGGYSFQVTTGMLPFYMRMGIVIKKGYKATNLQFKPQIEYGVSSRGWRSPVNSAKSQIVMNTGQIALKITSAEASSLIEQKADSIRLKASTLTWSATNSSLTKDGKLTVLNGQNGRSTCLEGGMINFRHNSTKTSYIGPFYWGDNYTSAYQGAVFLADTGAKYLGIGHGGASDIVINNGLNPDGETERVIFRDSVRSENKIVVGKSDNYTISYTTYNGAAKAHFNKGIYAGAFAVFEGYSGCAFSTTSINGSLYVDGSMVCAGAKPRLVKTKDYGRRFEYAYETPTPLFGDVGEGIVAEDGYSYIFIDPIFAELVNPNSYQVFLQAYGEGDLVIFDRQPSHFIVKGTPGIKFGWEIKAPQRDYEDYRMEEDMSTLIDITENNVDYGEEFYTVFDPEANDIYGAAVAEHLDNLYEGMVI